MNGFYQSPLLGREDYFLSIGSHAFHAHWHSELEALYTLSGVMRVCVDGQDYDVPEGYLVLVSGAREHAVTPLQDGTRSLVLELGYALLGERYERLLSRRFTELLLDLRDPCDPCEPHDPHTPHDETCAHLRGTLERLEPLCGRTDAFDEWRVRSELFRFAALLTELPHDDTPPEDAARRLSKLRGVQDALSYVAAHFAEPLTVRRAAEITSYEPKSFCRVFRTATGLTFHAYLNRVRVERARILLQSGGMTVAEVGEAVGFPQPKTFSRVFRTVAGMTPTDFLRTHPSDIR